MQKSKRGNILALGGVVQGGTWTEALSKLWSLGTDFLGAFESSKGTEHCQRAAVHHQGLVGVVSGLSFLSPIRGLVELTHGAGGLGTS